MDLDLRQLRTFCRVVELQSFSRAAASMELAQATVSERVARLEGAVGARLLDRLGRRVEPTPLGRLLYARGQELLGLHDRTRAEVEDLLGRRSGPLALCASTIPGEYILPSLIARFRDEHPGVRVSLSIADSAAVLEQVAEGRAELGIVGSRAPDKRFESHPLWRDELVVAVGRGHPLHRRKGEEITVAELRDLSIISREDGSGTRRAVEEQLGRDFRVVATLGSSTAVKEGVKAGLGAAFISRRAVSSEQEAGSVRALTLRGVELSRTIHLARDRRRTLSPLALLMRDYLRSIGDPDSES